MTEFDDVKDWHMKMGLRIDLTDDDNSSYVFAGRIRLISEEFAELTKAFMVGSFEELADALADLTWVVLGTAVEFGLPFNEVWREVKRSNFTKIGGKPDAGGKIMKPANYHPPEIGKILEKKMNAIGGGYGDSQLCRTCYHKKIPSHEPNLSRGLEGLFADEYLCLECGSLCKM